MHAETTKDYYERRAEQELIAAEEAADARARDSHRELADHYRDLAAGVEVVTSDDDEPGDAGTVSRGFRIVP